MRGNQEEVGADYNRKRSIPASAGQPSAARRDSARAEEHPRECGATMYFYHAATANKGASPRVRGNQDLPDKYTYQKRSIPASAGQPHRQWRCVPLRGEHPRECGATLKSQRRKSTEWGASPRVRGNP